MRGVLDDQVLTYRYPAQRTQGSPHTLPIHRAGVQAAAPRPLRKRLPCRWSASQIRPRQPRQNRRRSGHPPAPGCASAAPHGPGQAPDRQCAGSPVPAHRHPVLRARGRRFRMCPGMPSLISRASGIRRSSAASPSTAAPYAANPCASSQLSLGRQCPPTPAPG